MRKRIAHKTWLEKERNSFKVTLHNTVVIENTGTEIILNSGGWRTRTTKERINRFLPAGYRVYQKSFDWFVVKPNIENDEAIDGLPIEMKFFDGMRLPLPENFTSNVTSETVES